MAELIKLDLATSLKSLYLSNLKLQEDACVFLAKFCVVTGIRKDVVIAGNVDEDIWSKARSVTMHGRHVLSYIASHHKEVFSPFFDSYELAFISMSNEQKIDELIVIQQHLQIAFNRLDLNVELCSNAFNLLEKNVSDTKVSNVFDRIFLAKADLSGLQLRGLSMRGAQLQGANLSKSRWERVDLQDVQLQEANLSNSSWKDADLSGAQLQGAKVSSAYLGDAKLDGANWWAADFSNDDNIINNDFLEAMAYLYPLPQDFDLKEAHSSTTAFITNRRELTRTEPALGWPLKGVSR